MFKLLDYISNLAIPFDDLLVIITINVGLVLLTQVFREVKANSAVAKIIKLLIRIVAGFLLFSGILYGRFRIVQNEPAGFDTLLVSGDVILAHIVLTLPILLEIYAIFNRFGEILIVVLILLLAIPLLIIARIINLIGSIFRRRYEKIRDDTDSNILIFPVIFSIFLQFLVKIASTVGLMWLLFVGTIDLQQLLFGAYDGAMGWNFPTSFRFTNLFNQVQGLLQNLGGNEALSIFITFLVIGSSALLLLGASAEAVSHLGEGFISDKSQERLLRAIERLERDRNSQSDLQRYLSR